MPRRRKQAEEASELLTQHHFIACAVCVCVCEPLVDDRTLYTSTDLLMLDGLYIQSPRVCYKVSASD